MSDEILNKLAELSEKINKMASSLREFEKQRIDPKFEEVAREIRILTERVTTLEHSYSGMYHDTVWLEEEIKKLKVRTKDDPRFKEATEKTIKKLKPVLEKLK